MYMEQNALNDNNCWAGNIKNIIDTLGYSEIFNNIENGVN